MKRLVAEKRVKCAVAKREKLGARRRDRPTSCARPLKCDEIDIRADGQDTPSRERLQVRAVRTPDVQDALARLPSDFIEQGVIEFFMNEGRQGRMAPFPPLPPCTVEYAIQEREHVSLDSRHNLQAISARLPAVAHCLPGRGAARDAGADCLG